ncbi:MAG: UDP binding domain-containing protein [Caldilineaceae bacterium]
MRTIRQAMANAAQQNPQLGLVEDPYELADGADALLVCTDWNEFKQLDLNRVRDAMRTPIFADGRTYYNPDTMLALGFQYRSVGKGATFHVNGY